MPVSECPHKKPHFYLIPQQNNTGSSDMMRKHPDLITSLDNTKNEVMRLGYSRAGSLLLRWFCWKNEVEMRFPVHEAHTSLAGIRTMHDTIIRKTMLHTYGMPGAWEPDISTKLKSLRDWLKRTRMTRMTQIYAEVVILGLLFILHAWTSFTPHFTTKQYQ